MELDTFLLDQANLAWFLKEFVAKNLDTTILFQKEVEDAVAQQQSIHVKPSARSKAASQTNG